MFMVTNALGENEKFLTFVSKFFMNRGEQGVPINIALKTFLVQ